MNRREFIVNGLAAASGLALAEAGRGAVAEAFRFELQKSVIPAPKDPAEWLEFRRQLTEWRRATRQSLNYSGALYDRADFAWARTNFCCCFLMLCDETFYDQKRGHYRVREFIEHGQREFGGYDSVVLWHAYPRIGLDDRNQFDFYRDMPGGLPGLRRVADDFHRAGVRVFLNYNPWDTGTRREGVPDLEALCQMIAALDADGLFLDTMDRAAAEFRAMLDAARAGVALESELALPVERIGDHHFSWGQWFADSEAPGVLRNKWFERRHLQHQIKRWDQDHSGELHTAWMNGSGMMVWENVFGSWVGWNARDRATLRAMLPIQRRFATLLCGEDWTPLVPTFQADTYASLWADQQLRLWTVVNRAAQAIGGELLKVELKPGENLYDLVTGRMVATAHSSIGPRGIGAFLAARSEDLGRDFMNFLDRQRMARARASDDAAPPRLVTKLVATKAAQQNAKTPTDMVAIPGANVTLRIEVRERECGFYDSTPAGGHRYGDVYNFRTRIFERKVELRPFAIDLTPVTNAQFEGFLRVARYRPRHPENFLKHWEGGLPAAGMEEHPVVYVSLADARAYARWAGKRLPTEEEWQYAAQGPEGRRYPWGNEMRSGCCNGGETGGTTPVRAFPDGRSPFGLFDLCGNTWEWTESERTDGRTRFCMIRGGSWYHAKGSGWYMDGGPRPANYAAKFLLMWPGLDRCATIGFRCAR